MKHTVTYHPAASRFAVLCLSLSLLLAGAALPIFASEPLASEPLASETLPLESEQDPHYATFTYDRESHSVIAEFPANDLLETATTVTYRPYVGSRTHPLLSILPIETRILYENQLVIDGRSYDRIFSDTYGGDILFLESEEDTLVLFSDHGRECTDTLLSERVYTDHAIRVPREQDDGTYAKMDDEQLRALTALSAAGGEQMSMSLQMLRYTPHYEVIGYGETSRCVGMTIGLIYDLDGIFYYLPLDDLPHTLLTSDGQVDFSSDREMVFYRLTENLSDTFERVAKGSSAYRHRADYEREYAYALTDPSLIVMLCVIFGILIPVAPVVVGLCNCFSGKRCGRRRWLVLVGMGGVWMLCGLLLTVLVSLHFA